MIIRRKTRKIKLGSVYVGGDADISIQSMCNTRTEDILSTVSQIKGLLTAGCDIVRVAANNVEAAEAIREIKAEVPKVPLVADIHFDYKLAIRSIENGADGIRINPGNIGSSERVREILRVASDYNVPVRIGINSGSLPEKVYNSDEIVEKMLSVAKSYIDLFIALKFENIKVSLKSSNVLETIEVNERFSELYDFPLHLGITEAGTTLSGAIKSSIGIGVLLYKGIGDTIRVSLSSEPIEEVEVAKKILKYLGIRKGGVDVISCPTCGRTNGDVIQIAQEIEKRVKNVEKDIKVAVMGCEVNGPGEARMADIGVAFGKHDALLFKNGSVLKKVSKEEVLDILLEEIKKM